jgi:hypothetical protein
MKSNQYHLTSSEYKITLLEFETSRLTNPCYEFECQLYTGKQETFSSQSESSSSKKDDKDKDSSQPSMDKKNEKNDKKPKENIEFICYDSAMNPIKNLKYILITPDGESKGKTDDEGKIKKTNITQGECSIKFI